ncbi:tail protein X [Pseudochrobactrum asaccharolyticum]|uniref:Phage tail protein X n=1 Tax=Pseudochrobactrum asaccharolyticum TaxID=354351 RepID=A0A366DKA8_9HYPH|nr:tail protein X [Pseudochrobactrum asaccharolyticum]RBO90527.1 phage tail protein X [Pseudochrobactrum asaccharolyticum]
MKNRVVSSSTGESVYVTVDDDMLDDIAYVFYGSHAKNTELLIEANPHVLDLDLLLPAGTRIVLPRIAQPVSPKPFKQLWD